MMSTKAQKTNSSKPPWISSGELVGRPCPQPLSLWQQFRRRKQARVGEDDMALLVNVTPAGSLIDSSTASRSD